MMLCSAGAYPLRTQPKKIQKKTQMQSLTITGCCTYVFSASDG